MGEEGAEAEWDLRSRSSMMPAGRRTAHAFWQPDSAARRCSRCRAAFTFFRRRHHCRRCGYIFCGRCSSTRTRLEALGSEGRVRVCDGCAPLKNRGADVIFRAAAAKGHESLIRGSRRDAPPPLRNDRAGDAAPALHNDSPPVGARVHGAAPLGLRGSGGVGRQLNTPKRPHAPLRLSGMSAGFGDVCESNLVVTEYPGSMRDGVSARDEVAGSQPSRGPGSGLAAPGSGLGRPGSGLGGSGLAVALASPAPPPACVAVGGVGGAAQLASPAAQPTGDAPSTLSAATLPQHPATAADLPSGSGG